MPGPAFHFKVLDLAVAQLGGSGAADAAKAQVMKDHPTFARLGALGPDLLRHTPVDTKALDTLTQKDLKTLSQDELKALALQVHPSPAMAVYGVLFRVLVPMFANLSEVDAFLAKMAGIAAAEDAEALKASKAELDAVKPKIDGLKALGDAGQASLAAGLGAVVLGKPLIQTTLPWAPQTWRPLEVLRWKRTGRFAKNLVDAAKNQNDTQLLAYAYGYAAHTAAAITGEPFVNSIVGGPYRTHWWRNQFVRNHVDTWTFGRYETPASMSGDDPTPWYAAWKELCGANLHTTFAVDAGVTGPAAASAVQAGSALATPGFDKVAALLVATAQATYGAAPAVSVPTALTNPATFQRAYLGALAVLWFMTGGRPLCVDPPGTPPAGSETPPPWFGSGGNPPSPSPGGGGGGGGGGGATASGIIAAILAVLAILTGSLIAAVGAIILAIAAATSGGGGAGVNWVELRGTIYWMQVLMFQIEDGIHKSLVAGGLGYPSARHLGTKPGGLFGNVTVPVFDSGMPPVVLTRSGPDDALPRRMDEREIGGKTVPPDTFFREYPKSAVEEPGANTLIKSGLYPDAIIDGVGLLNGGALTDDGTEPTRQQPFGGAVANAAAVIAAEAGTLVNYNLDGDRGYGWKTWRPKLGTKPADPAPVQWQIEP